MVHDRLDRWRLHAPAGSRLARAFGYLAAIDPFAVPDGRVDVEGDTIFALHQQYDTRAIGDCRFESHRTYIDIQFVFEGEEIMGCEDVDRLAVRDPYDPAKDIAFYEWPASHSSALVRAGEFAIFHPGDGHAPGIRAGAAHVRKIVMKVMVGP